MSRINVKHWISGLILIAACAGVSFGQQTTTKPVSTDKKEQTEDKVKAVDSKGPAVYQPGKRSPFEDTESTTEKLSPGQR